MSNPNRDLVEQFDNEILSAVDNKRQREDNQKAVTQASETVIYGELIRKYLETTIGAVKTGKVESAIVPNKTIIADAVDFLSQAAIRTEQEYEKTHQDVLYSPRFIQEINNLRVNVAQGIIQLLSEEYGMNSEEGKKQVEFADTAFSSLGQNIQLLMAGLNYATFNNKTMLTGSALLENNDLDLSGWTEKQMQESMPHLVLSNLAIGQIVSALLQRAKPKENFSILDTGSGTGCTLAGSTLGVRDAIDKGFDSFGLSMTAIEGSRKFYNEELLPFSNIVKEKIPEISFKKLILNHMATHEVIANNTLNLVYGDILDSLKHLKFSKEDLGDGVIIITANYVWHRLPRIVKDAIIKEITIKTPNTIFLVADLVQNASEVNRRYFNFRDNGLLNCGNIGLDALFKFNGYRMIELNENSAPKTMDRRLARQIGNGTTSDSIFYIAYRGEKASNLVENW